MRPLKGPATSSNFQCHPYRSSYQLGTPAVFNRMRTTQPIIVMYNVAPVVVAEAMLVA